MENIIFESFFLEIFLLSAILFILAYNAWTITSGRYNFPIIDKEVFNQSIFILFICLLLNINMDFGAASAMGIFVNDLSAQNIKTIVLVSVIGALICGKPYFIAKKINLFEYYILVMLAVFSLLFLSTANDLISLYLCIEMQSICFYVLASFNRYSVFSTEAGLKYFVLGVLSSCIFLLGSSIIYGLLGTTNLSNIALLLANFDYISGANFFLLNFAFILLLVTIFFKLAAAPFHIWSPDVYEGSPLNSTIIFVLVPKTVFLFLILRLYYTSFYPFFLPFKTIFLICGSLSVLIGTFLALQQRRLKKLMVYSSISHVGFMLLAFSTGTVLGVVSVFYYMIFYIITGFLIWGLISLTFFDKHANLYLTDFSGLIKKNPSKALAFGLGFFSLAGIPPMVGFSMKFFIFSASMEASLYEASLLIIMLSVVGSFYYLRLIKIIFFEEQQAQNSFIEKTFFSDLVALLISACLIIIVFGFINPSFALLVSYKIAAGSLFV